VFVPDVKSAFAIVLPSATAQGVVINTYHQDIQEEYASHKGVFADDGTASSIIICIRLGGASKGQGAAF